MTEQPLRATIRPFRAGARTDDQTGYVVRLDHDYYETSAVSWSVEEYPSSDWAEPPGSANSWSEVGGLVSYTATGRLLDSDHEPVGEEIDIAGYCPIHVELIEWSITPGGLIDFTVPHRLETGRAAAPNDCSTEPPS